MSKPASWLDFLRCQKEILFHKLKIYGISKKIEDNYRMIGEEVYLFSQRPKSHKSVLSHGRVKFLLDEVEKDHAIIIETENEIFQLKERFMETDAEADSAAEGNVSEEAPSAVQDTEESHEQEDKPSKS